MWVIVQQQEQSFEKFSWLRMLATFLQFGLQNYVTVSITLYTIYNSNGKYLLAIVDEKKIYHKSFITQAMFSMQLEFGIFNLEISLFSSKRNV